MIAFEDKMRQGGAAALEEAERFFMKQGAVNNTLTKIAAKLESLRIPYAVAGGMALVAHGYDRTTVDVDILVDAEGLKSVHQQLEGLGYVPPFAGSKQLRDVETSVRIEFLVTGQFPGDGKLKPVAFPDPSEASEVVEGIRYLRLDRLIELKLASGISNPGRQKDLGDVQELIRILKIPGEFKEQLNPYVREKFDELWKGIEQSEPLNP